MVFFDMQEFGGLEEYAATLAVGLKTQGHEVSAITMAWVPPDNQYLQRLRENHIEFAQLPKWVSLPASDWATKQKILAALMWLLTPLVYVLALGRYLRGNRAWEGAVTSARAWLSGQLLNRFLSHDQRQPFARFLLNWWHWRWRPDILHIQGYTSNLLFVIEWAYAKGIPVVYEEHQTPDPQFNWWQDFRQSINKVARVVAVSDKSAEALRTVCGVTRPIVVRSPLLPDPMASGWSRPPRSEQRLLAPVMTTVARLYVTKGLEYLLDAIVLVRAKHADTQFHVHGDGPMREGLLARAAQLGLDGPAIFVGAFTSRHQLAEIMAETDIFVMSSVLEGQPLGVVEAMAFACPIVTTSVGGIPEIIQDGVNGLLCPPHDPACLADHICALLEDTQLRVRLGAEARATYANGPYQPSAVCSFFAVLYQEVISEYRHISSVTPILGGGAIGK